MKKRFILAAIAGLCLLLLPLSAGAGTVHSGKWGDLSWSLDSKGLLVISGTGAINPHDVDSPDTYLEYIDDIESVYIRDGITAIGNHAFADCYYLTTIFIPDSVTSIGEAAFSDSGLVSIDIPDSVTRIGGWAFNNCCDLCDITIPDSVTSIGEEAFYNCSSLTEIVIPDGVTSIRSWTFGECTELTSVTIPDSVTSIGEEAFYNCLSLTKLVIPDSVVSIGDCAFYYCSDLTDITLPGSVRIIGEECFYHCRSLDGVVIPDGITTIPYRMFYACTSLTDVTIPDSVKSIGAEAFSYCNDLTIITIPDSVQKFGKNIFTLAPAVRCGKGSAAEAWAAGLGYEVIYMDEQALAITAQPEPVTVLPGETAAFTVAADGKDLAWQWYYQKPGDTAWTKVSKNGTSATYSLTTATRHNGYSYRCTVTDGSGTTADSDAALLTVIAPPAVTCQPVSVTLAAGEKASFTVEADGTDLTWQWYYQKPGASAWTAVLTGGTSASYTLTAAARHNGYSYRCKVTNAAGSVFSSTAVLTVASKPVITAQPASLSVSEGKTASFKVSAGGTGLKFRWYYRKPGASGWTVVYTNGASDMYTLTVASRHDGYAYRCLVSNAAGSVYSDEAVLTVASKPVITAQPASMSAAEGKTAEFTVTAGGTGLKYRWYYKKPGDSGWTAVYTNGTSDTYTLTVAARHDGYSYRCLVSNAAGSEYSDAAVLTVAAKPVITAQPKSRSAGAGEQATFSVTASGTGLKYQWYYKKPGDSSWTAVSKNGTSATYMLTVASRHNGYTYRCKVTNASGYVYSSTVKLTVNP